MKKSTPVLLLLILSAVWISHTNIHIESSAEASFTYDETKGPWEQPNPVFRWPLPNVSGEAHINVRLVMVNSESSVLVSTDIIEEAKSFTQNIYNPHGIYINYLENKDFELGANHKLIEDWNQILPTIEEEITLYILSDQLSEVERKDYYASNGIVSNKAIVPISGQQEFSVYLAKSLSHTLGLLPTYFENIELGVAAEDGSNCGFAGDFVCDTPFDHLGLKNEVKRRNCKYKGDFGNPDARNLMSNSWTECMDHITEEQGNKIKYNLSVIPSLQKKLTASSSIPLNVGTVDQNTINQVTLK
jgi:hypothetical protein